MCGCACRIFHLRVQAGCGKTQISLCAASELGIPLIQFDMGCMISKWVGETEANVRNAWEMRGK